MDEKKMISQGGFGCVYYPKIKCVGKIYPISNTSKNATATPDKKMISKFTKYDAIAVNEYEIGKKIKKIYKTFKKIDKDIFIYVEKLCVLDNTPKAKPPFSTNNTCQLKIKSKKNCLLYSKYYDANHLHDIIFKNFSLEFYNQSYHFLLLSCALLYNRFKIIHMDLHANNVLYSNKTNKYHIIDFGISLDLEKALIDKKYLKYMLYYNYKTPSIYYPIEMYILIYFLRKNKKLEILVLSKLIKTYYNKFQDEYGDYMSFIIDNKSLDDYMEEVLQYYINKFVNNSPIKLHIETILREASFSWDLYRVSEYFVYLMYLNNGGPARDVRNMNIIDDKMSKTLKMSLHYDYTKRPLPIDIINQRLKL
tara:strand:+ start:2870 stop:3961 length:1092 start_codon:yes stop_codon:yes gene_type:complete